MHRELQREKAIPGFVIGIGELELLVKKLSKLFSEPEKVRVSINVKRNRETLNFDTVDEIKSYSENLGTVRDFSIWLTQGDKRIWIRTPYANEGKPRVSVQADDEAWCAGAIETAYSFFAANRIWYGWATSLPYGWIAAVTVNIPTLSMIFGHSIDLTNKATFISLAILFIASASLWFTRSKVMPPALLRITETESLIEKYQIRITIFLALVSAITAVATLIYTAAHNA